MKWTTGTIITVLCIGVSIVASWSVAQYQIGELRGDVKTLQQDVAMMRTQRAEDREAMVEVRNDVRWIRDAIERMTEKPR